MTIRAVLFDLDGTLVDSLADLTDAVNHMRGAFGLPSLDEAGVRRMVGKGARNLVQRALDGQAGERLEEGLGLFTAYNEAHIVDKSRLYPGAAELLAELAVAGLRLAVISNKNTDLSRLILKELGIDRHFELIVGGDAYAEMKPSPLPLREVMGALGVRPEEAVMVGDSVNDIAAGRAAGIVTIGCAWGYGGAPEVADADRVVDRLDEIPAIVNGVLP